MIKYYLINIDNQGIKIDNIYLLDILKNISNDIYNRNDQRRILIYAPPITRSLTELEQQEIAAFDLETLKLYLAQNIPNKLAVIKTNLGYQEIITKRVITGDYESAITSREVSESELKSFLKYSYLYNEQIKNYFCKIDEMKDKSENKDLSLKEKVMKKLKQN